MTRDTCDVYYLLFDFSIPLLERESERRLFLRKPGDFVITPHVYSVYKKPARNEYYKLLKVCVCILEISEHCEQQSQEILENRTQRGITRDRVPLQCARKTN